MVLLCLLLALIIGFSEPRSFTIDYQNNCFLKDGQPFRYISGGMHYFRVPEFYWEDRLKKIKAAGLNAIQTYVAWNVHEPTQGKYVFEGMYDVESFIKLAKEQGLLVIVRADYLGAVDSWLSVLLPKLKPLLYENGGPIISVQVENEYGSYFTCDSSYMEHLKNSFRKYLGNNVILFTTDGYSDKMLQCGGIPELYRTVDFGAGDPTEPFKQQRKFQQKGPLVNSEYYTGWLDHWGSPHQRRNATTIASYLDRILAMNASVNMYMFEGGTNFGFMNGANSANKHLLPVPTSYDYDAPLDESGNYTAKYFEIRKVVCKYTKAPPGPLPTPIPKLSFGKIKIDKLMSLYSMLAALYPGGPLSTSQYPKTMEEIGQNYGFLMYRTFLTAVDGRKLTINGLRDRAVVLIDEKVQGRLDRNNNTNSIIVDRGSVLDILVENQGRINYGPLNDPKGIVGNVTLDGKTLQNWGMFPITFDEKQLTILSNLDGYYDDETDPPLLARATFQASSNTADTFLGVDNWSKKSSERTTLEISLYQKLKDLNLVSE
eukprot:gene14374-5422_t